MAGNGNAGEEEGNEGNEEQPPKGGGELRKKLEETLAKNADLSGKLAIHEAGLSHLSERQRRAVVRDVQDDEKEVNADTLKAAAKELGYPETKVAEKPEGEGEDGGEGAEGEGGEGQPNPEEVLSSFDAIERARRAAVPQSDPTSFESRMKATKSAAEAEALIKTEGHKVGIVHEHDIE